MFFYSHSLKNKTGDCMSSLNLPLEIATANSKRSKELLEVASKIAESLSNSFPIETVFVFGSVARGTATRHSDIDMIVVMSTTEEQKNRTTLLLPYLDSVDVGVDLFVLTPEEWREWKEKPNRAQQKVLEEGVIVYGLRK